MSLLLQRGMPRVTQAGFVALDELKVPWVERFMLYKSRTIPVVSTVLKGSDRWGRIKARWGFGRMRSIVPPGLYAVGSPSADSSVFVSANYKLSFDALRSHLGGLDCWILVLDTRGINVWCAAGKGTFSTDELVSRIATLRLSSVVDHRSVVLPQLGAPGVSAPEVAKRSGFRVEWGPVRAEDIPAWLAANRVKTEAMRSVTFGLRDRLAVAPVELVHSWPIVPAAVALGALYGLPAGRHWLGRAAPAAIILLGTIPAGTILFPALLPWLPTRIFAVKGAILGAAWAALAALLFRLPLLSASGGILIEASAVAFLGMNFTGSTTFTCQPGALQEVEKGFWPMVISLASGLAMAAISRIFGI
jgi:hypothetical protein